MNKSDLISVVAEKNELTKKDAEKIVTQIFDTIVGAVAAGEKVQLVGFGTFEQKIRKERTGVDPRTHQSITIPEAKVPSFKAGKAFKDIVDNK